MSTPAARLTTEQKFSPTLEKPLAGEKMSSMAENLLSPGGESAFARALIFCYELSKNGINGRDQASLFLLKHAIAYRKVCLEFRGAAEKNQGVASLKFLAARWILVQEKNLSLENLPKALQELQAAQQQLRSMGVLLETTVEDRLVDLSESSKEFCNFGKSKKELLKSFPGNDNDNALALALNNQLIHAAQTGNCTLACALLSLGLDLSMQDSSGMTLLHRAVQDQAVAPLQDQAVNLQNTYLLNFGSKLKNLDAQYCHQEAMILMLGILGADPNMKNNAGDTPLAFALSALDLCKQGLATPPEILAAEQALRALMYIGAKPSEAQQEHPLIKAWLEPAEPAAPEPVLFSLSESERTGKPGKPGKRTADDAKLAKPPGKSPRSD